VRQQRLLRQRHHPLRRIQRQRRFVLLVEREVLLVPISVPLLEQALLLLLLLVLVLLLVRHRMPVGRRVIGRPIPIAKFVLAQTSPAFLPYHFGCLINFLLRFLVQLQSFRRELTVLYLPADCLSVFLLMLGLGDPVPPLLPLILLEH
tara:strand:- start:73 stop:516 length:444 start_codon:yes stop_codon:yes gene_type:complete